MAEVREWPSHPGHLMIQSFLCAEVSLMGNDMRHGQAEAFILFSDTIQSLRDLEVGELLSHSCASPGHL